MVDTTDLKSVDQSVVRVQVPLPPIFKIKHSNLLHDFLIILVIIYIQEFHFKNQNILYYVTQRKSL